MAVVVIVPATARVARTPFRRLGRQALLAAVIALSAAVLTACAREGPAAQKPELVGLAGASERTEFDLVLRLPGRGKLARTLDAVLNPHSRDFRRFVDASSFGARFGIRSDQLHMLERVLAAAGLRVVAVYPQRTAIRVRGTVARIERFLRVRIGEYRDGSGDRWQAPLGNPVLPAPMAPLVSGVDGLDTRRRFAPLDVPAGGLTPQNFARAYDLAPLHSRGLMGQGETIALISYSAYNPRDPSKFASSFGLGGPEPRVIKVEGGTEDTRSEDEPDLDIEVIREVAPDARILVYELSPIVSEAAAIERIVAERSAEVVSSSWGEGCLPTLSSVQRQEEGNTIESAELKGVSIFVASGDAGAYDCQRDDLTDHELSVDWPSASPGVISVGGTRLYLDSEGNYVRETAWEGALSNSGGGGGLATGIPRPAWQSAPGVNNGYSNGSRQVPDVSADADPGTGWLTYSGQEEAGEAGGTSAATPFWAASMLLIDQYARTQGISSTGFVDPILYALASRRQAFPPFHEVAFGGNRFYQAGPGWNFATGLGSPDVWNLARDIVAYLRAHPGAAVSRGSRR